VNKNKEAAIVKTITAAIENKVLHASVYTALRTTTGGLAVSIYNELIEGGFLDAD